MDTAAFTEWLSVTRVTGRQNDDGDHDPALPPLSAVENAC
jgi:hypothetical protein